jgi:hypothetical protein
MGSQVWLGKSTVPRDIIFLVNNRICLQVNELRGISAVPAVPSGLVLSLSAVTKVGVA